MHGGVGGAELRGSPLSRMLALFGHVAMSDLSPECEPKRTSTDHYARRHPAGLDFAPVGDEIAVRAVTRFRPPRPRSLVGQPANLNPPRGPLLPIPIA